MPPRIKAALDLIKSHFIPAWWHQYNFHKTLLQASTLNDDIERFKKDLVQLEDKIFDELNFSLFEGEYCHYADFLERLTELNNLILEVQPTFTPPELAVMEVLVGELNANFIQPIKLAVSQYSDLHHKVQVKLTLIDKNYLLSYHDDLLISSAFENLDENSQNNIRFFFANIEIAHCDHFLSIESDDLDNLFRLSNELDTEINVKPYSKTLKQKCDFLLAKILLRQKIESKTPVAIRKNATEQEFDIRTFTADYFVDEIDYILTHYERKENWRETLIKHFERVKLERYEDLQVRDLHRLIKYYKDVKPNLQCLQDIRREFQRRFDDAKSKKESYNFYVYAIGLNYCINNEFSLLCSLETTTLPDAESLYNEITRIQDVTGVKNYFPQTKYLLFLIKELRKIYNTKQALELYESCQQLITKCENLIPTYEMNLKWATDNYNFVFQLPYEECRIKTTSPQAPYLWVFSSFLLPLPQDQYHDEFQKGQEVVNRFESSIDVWSNIHSEFEQLKTVKSDLIELRDDAKNKEIRTMEVLGIFTAIVTFLAGSLSGFKFVDTGGKALLFMLALSSSLGIFVLLLLTINRGIESVKKHKTMIIALSVIAVIFWGLVTLLDFKTSAEKCPSVKKDSLALKTDAIINSNNFIKIYACDTCRSVPTQTKTITRYRDKVIRVKDCPNCP